MYSAMNFSILRRLCNHYNNLHFHHFHHPKKHAWSPQQPLISLTFCLFIFALSKFYTIGIIHYVFLCLCVCLASFTWHNVFWVSHVVRCINTSFLFIGDYYSSILPFVYLFITWWIVGLFPLFGYCE